VDLITHIADAHKVITDTNEVTSTVKTVKFEYWYDANANGEADDAGSAWTFATNAANTGDNIAEWTATWDNAGLLKGHYLIRIVAQDDQDNVRYSTDPANLGGVITLNSNTCGINPPNIQKSADPTSLTVGEGVTFTISLSNTLAVGYDVSSITDILPSGFTYQATVGGSLAPDTSPTPGASGQIVWTFAPETINAGSTETLVYTATATSVPGTYANQAQAATTSILNPGTGSAVVDVGEPALSLSKSGTPLAVEPGDTLTYTLTYGNDSTVDVTNVVINDTLPTSTSFVSASDGGSLVGNTVVWNLGALPAGETGRSVSFVIQVNDPYTGTNPLVNTALIDSDDTSPGSSNPSNTFIDAPFPELSVSKSASRFVAGAGDTLIYTITYGNSGDAAATGVVLTDAVPSDLTYVPGSASNGGSESGGVVTSIAQKCG
jgi:uncharacterized repeat protein (TIGR01451 family)